MGFSKKTGKGRLDKYYFLAKDQGFRARSAFKLIQLNKKYNFLEKARVLVDLCAAPGGWLQVAAKYMPVSQLIIGIDLVAIKPIPNVITLVDDITSEKCRADLKRELKTWKADVFLNDGAPNVGSSWAHDAFTQAELVLSALKLATEFLNEGGTFVTKIFRSKDYNSLLWVFKHLFRSVEATKPASSRNVSAEIFVVCRGYLAPSSIDPRFLDPKHVFQELTSADQQSKSGLVNILKPEKKQRSREGYADDATVLHKRVPAIDFVRAADPVAILGSANELSFEDEASRDLVPFADEDIRISCQDLKVVGRKEFKALLKWRAAIRERFQKRKQQQDDQAEAGEAPDSSEESDALEALDELAAAAQKKAKREKRKALERKAKQRLRLQLQMENTQDLADDMQEEGLFSIKALRRKAGVSRVIDQEGPADEDETASDAGSAQGGASGEESGYEGEEEDEEERRVAKWEEEMEESYERFKSARLEKDALRFVKQKHEEALDGDRLEEGGEEQEDEDDAMGASSYSGDDSSAGSSEDELNVQIDTADERKAALKAKADLFYANPLFGLIDTAKSEAAVAAKKRVRFAPDEAEGDGEPEEEEEEVPQSERKKKKMRRQKDQKGAAREKEPESKGIVFVKADTTYDDGDDDDDAAANEGFEEKTKRMMTDPAAISLAHQLVAERRRKKQDMLDDSFSRYAFGPSHGLPAWFLEEESRHYKPQIPITKEAAAAIREKLRKLEATPSRKVLEAKGRNKMRALKRIEALQKKAAVIADSEEIGGKQKSMQIERLMRAGKKPTKKEKKVVVAKGKLKGVKGRPRGVKGHYKMVDGRAKKDMRAQKAQSKRSKGGRR
jgi:AdoMet-dependent rRNA methyltransferase SPB1